MKKLGFLLGAGLIALAASATTGAQAQTMSYQQAGAMLAKSCGPDIMKYCANANLGGGKILGCLDANASKVSAKCKADFATAKASIAKRTMAQQAIFKVCNADAARLCQGVVPGDGNLITCLVDASKAVSKACNQTITDAGWR
ncbi:hypothetical protein GCM10007301_05240 [Azorhizobium oxalatiphilum]|uniref:Cysteine rich repeat protein n=1 Tax=Azorhizobium oxalatiphilum TaxID=980631 RepID=A0A917BLF1_9HYPH|nr:cysteine rich repeat-containing protein [Azorhizobium oxalatiphilum]GGF48955.1 hypothetical protein GCM10007301_05240 [Azorhizobium oxalatiphilum]